MVRVSTSSSTLGLGDLRFLKAIQGAQEFAKEYHQITEFASMIQRLQDARGLLERLIWATRQIEESNLAAIAAARQYSLEWERLQSVIDSYSSVIQTVNSITPKQWALLAMGGFSASSLLWMFVSGGTPPAGQLPSVTFVDVVTILAGEAGHASSIAFELAKHYFETILGDFANRTLFLVLAAGVLAYVSDLGLSLKTIYFWLTCAAAAVMKLLDFSSE